jgi:hypothetical protein
MCGPFLARMSRTVAIDSLLSTPVVKGDSIQAYPGDGRETIIF